MKESGWQLEHSYAGLPDVFYKETQPETAEFPEIVLFNWNLAKSLGLDPRNLQLESSEVFSGNRIPDGGLPIAQAYAGHQFGNFTMLGDGRAILLGEQITPEGRRVDIQLKGAGRTVFSRMGDGRSPLGPMLREYIISEAMHALDIPSTRGLALVTTGEAVSRDRMLPGAVLTRVAASHLRVGTFEYAARLEDASHIRTLADYAMERHYPEIEVPDKYLKFLDAVIDRQAALISRWQLVGFIHGVMNTDNMTISGETIDYGPCAFMDMYDPETVFSSIDVNKRYRYRNQPGIAQWNLARLAETLLPLIHDDKEEAMKIAQASLGNFGKLYNNYWQSGMRRKIGLVGGEEIDDSLANELLDLMHQYKADFTKTFRMLSLDALEDMPLYATEAFKNWYERWQERLESQRLPVESAYEQMRSVNPAVIPRNHLVEEALDAAVENGDFTKASKLIEVLSSPFEDGHDRMFKEPPEDEERVHMTYCGT
ncbi:YdiU family protein [Salinicoccus hispanicus]|uniref:Protein nucleotidyltransferase YdiU n=1 Tax=Salinicoccus hispanicus TaxID=157225 RepID=A0A6N8U1X9_9STAP|nr:YdiU family protein [Salinicoccus hispanicus]MXQ49689.1 YdiU family protein [Salinicoccus hispanicus]